MILKEVIVHNFRVFSGTHRFDLMPRGEGNQTRPIILFGGLNGSGKTSLLTAVRLGLYGKQAIGKSTPNKEYHYYLENNIHKNPQAIVPITDARVELIFNYARQGVVEEFRVIRSWGVKGQTVHENIGIHRNGIYLEEFNSDQCQAFLNELIPIGVSDLFFFDGEKIADLAEDESGKTLQTAVKKLLGLDIIERLRNDLSIYLRRENTKALPQEVQAEIAVHEKDMNRLIMDKTAAESVYESLISEQIEIQVQVGAINLSLDTQGGAWASSRRKEEQKQDQLIAQKRILEKTLLDEMAGAYPLSFAKNTLNSLLQKLKNTSDKRKKQETSKQISVRLVEITKLLQTQLADPSSRTIAEEALRNGFSDLIQPSEEPSSPHLDLSDTQIAKYEQWITVTAVESETRVSQIKAELASIEKELENSSLRLERAPEEDQLTKSLNKLKDLKSREGTLDSRIKKSVESIRSYLSKAMELNRKIEKLHASLVNNQSGSNALRHAKQSSELLSEFAAITAENRIKELEKAFIESYKKLARKEDLNISAKIDPKTFLIALLDDQENLIDRHEISAGEKQIYAIAILEALAKTSGRKLPIIIDTPLGRLDSKHRNKLVNNYFPRASHQVIILSTDTEIDQAFYQDLEKDISHAYHIDFDEKTKSSKASEGYFWNHDLVKEAI